MLDLSPPDPTTLRHTSGTIVHSSVLGRCISFFINNPKDPIQNHNLRGTFFEPDELNIMAKYIKPDAVCVDIGANIGNHALFVDLFTAAKTVILFEVNPDALFLLNIHFLLNRPRSWDMQHLGFALGREAGRVSKNLPDPDNLGGAQFRPQSDGAFRCITADSVLSARRIDFIKIDVEGGEMDVFEGMQKNSRQVEANNICRSRQSILLTLLRLDGEELLRYRREIRTLHWTSELSHHAALIAPRSIRILR